MRALRIAVCPLKMIIVSIVKAFTNNTRYVRTSELLQNANNHAPLMIRVERDRTRSTQAYQSYREGHSGGATAQPACGEAHLSAHERIAPTRSAWRAPQLQRAACEGGRSMRSARQAAAASPGLGAQIVTLTSCGGHHRVVVGKPGTYSLID